MNASNEIINPLLLLHVPIHSGNLKCNFGVSGNNQKMILRNKRNFGRKSFPRIHSDRRKGSSLSLDREESLSFRNSLVRNDENKF